jgi:hypothetical protein
MRLGFALALALLCMPAMAADTIADQAQKAYDIFAGGFTKPDFQTPRYGAAVTVDVGGKWAVLNGPDPRTGRETYGADTERACASDNALVLSSPNQLTMVMTSNVNPDHPFSQSYTLISGTTFAERVDVEDYFAAIGLGPERVGQQFDRARALALSQSNGSVHIFRPSQDIIVLVRDRGYPTVLARCP